MSNTNKFIAPYPLETAVLFLIFNRLDTTKEVFEEIRKAKPPRLYIASDGPRQIKKGEAELVQTVRDYVLNHIDWECEVKMLFRDQNMGCGPSVKTAIDWFFDMEEKGIILEDDCIPIQSFFWYAEALLERYRHDNRVAMISGTNHLTNVYKMPNSYAFSKYKACWGWASWRRSWKNMDFDMYWRGSNQSDSIIKNMGVGKASCSHWIKALKLIDTKKVSAWDWQWYFSVAAQNQLCLFPCDNLISNIGFGNNATHTFGEPKKAFIRTGEITLPLQHPQYVCQDHDYDEYFEKYKIKKIISVDSLLKVLRKIFAACKR
jgi:hypothetical protein